MPLESRLPQITAGATLRAQRAVSESVQHIEFLTLKHAAQRRFSGNEMSRIKGRVNTRNPWEGYVDMGAFYSRFFEYGTALMAARPALGPAAEEGEAAFLLDMKRIYG